MGSSRHYWPGLMLTVLWGEAFRRSLLCCFWYLEYVAIILKVAGEQGVTVKLS